MFASLRRLRRLAIRYSARKAAENRQEALRAFQDAVCRRDTRAQHITWPEAFRATCEALRAETRR